MTSTEIPIPNIDILSISNNKIRFKCPWCNKPSERVRGFRRPIVHVHGMGKVSGTSYAERSLGYPGSSVHKVSNCRLYSGCYMLVVTDDTVVSSVVLV